VDISAHSDSGDTIVKITGSLGCRDTGWKSLLGGCPIAQGWIRYFKRGTDFLHQAVFKPFLHNELKKHSTL